MKPPDSEHSGTLAEYVTAFYPGPSKHGLRSYYSWVQRLYRATRRTMLHFYVPSPDVAARLGALGAPESVIFHVLEEDQLPARHLQIDWQAQVELDPERAIHPHSDHLYVVWNSKTRLAQRVAEKLESERLLFWVDAGYVRSRRTQRLLGSFPRPWQVDAVATGGVHFLAIEAFTSQEVAARSTACPNDFKGMVRIGGGMFGATPDAWNSFTQAYEDYLEIWSQEGQFVGKDQYVFASMILQRPDLATAWTVTRRLGNPWFDLPMSLGRRRGA